MDGELKQSTAVTVSWGPFVDTNGAPVTTLTIQKADVRVKKNGGNMGAASADQGGSDAGAPHDELGVYDGSFNTTDTDTLGRLDVTINESGALPQRHTYQVVSAAYWDWKYGTTQPAVQAQIKKNTAYANFHFMMTDSTNHAPITGRTVTVTRAIDNGSFASGTLSAVTEIGNGMYRVDFAAADLNGNTITLRATAAGSDDTVITINTQP